MTTQQFDNAFEALRQAGISPKSRAAEAVKVETQNEDPGFCTSSVSEPFRFPSAKEKSAEEIDELVKTKLTWLGEKYREEADRFLKPFDPNAVPSDPAVSAADFVEPSVTHPALSDEAIAELEAIDAGEPLPPKLIAAMRELGETFLEYGKRHHKPITVGDLERWKKEAEENGIDLTSPEITEK